MRTKIKAGDHIKITRVVEWSGWTPSMTRSLGREVTVKEVAKDSLVPGGFAILPEETGSDADGFWFPSRSVELVKPSTKPEEPEWLTRLRAESADLQQKLGKLKSFLSNRSEILPELDWDILRAQQRIMEKYDLILRLRLDRAEAKQKAA